jgi:hypothetical protein
MKDNFNLLKWNRDRYLEESLDKKSKDKVKKSYDLIISLIKKQSRLLNDDESYELHEELKKFFNKLI